MDMEPVRCEWLERRRTKCSPALGINSQYIALKAIELPERELQNAHLAPLSEVVCEESTPAAALPALAASDQGEFRCSGGS